MVDEYVPVASGRLRFSQHFAGNQRGWGVNLTASEAQDFVESAARANPKVIHQLACGLLARFAKLFHRRRDFGEHSRRAARAQGRVGGRQRSLSDQAERTAIIAETFYREH